MSHEPEGTPRLRERDRARPAAAAPFEMTEAVYREFLLFACGASSDAGRKEFPLSPLLHRFVEEAVKRGHLEPVGDEFKMTELGWKASEVEEIDYTPPPPPATTVVAEPDPDTETDEWTSE